MQRPGAAERHQRELARVDAALDRHHPQRPRHLLVRDADDPLGGLQLAEAELVREPGDRGAGRLGVELDAAGERRLRRQQAEDEVGVGHGRLGAAAPVAGGPRVGARRAGADAKRSSRVAPGDRAAAGADRVDVDHRQLDHAPADLARVGPPHAAVLDDADVARGAAHVEPDRVAVPREARQQRGADGTAGGPGEDGLGAGAGRLGERGDAARGLHHRRFGEAAPPGRLGETLEVAAEKGGEVGVDHGRRAALVLAELRQHLVRDRDVDSLEPLAQPLRQRPLVGGVEVGEEQADRDRLGPGPLELIREALDLLGVEWLDHPVRRDPLGGAEAQVAGGQRRRLRRAQVVEAGAVLARDLEQVGEAGGRHQRRAGATLLEQRVGADRHPVRERLDLAGGGPGTLEHLLDRGDHALGLVAPASSAPSPCAAPRRRRGRRR